MKKFLLPVVLSICAAGAQAQVTFSGGTNVPMFSGYNPTGGSGMSGTGPMGGLETATLSTTAGLVIATFLGYEAGRTDTFTLGSSLGILSNRSVLESSIAGVVAAGGLDFTFLDTFDGTMVGNGQSGGAFSSYAVLGSFTGGVFSAYTLGGAYDVILGFNDGAQGDADYDDMVVGLRVTPVPEPETYALMLAGLGALWFANRRVKSRKS